IIASKFLDAYLLSYRPESVQRRHSKISTYLLRKTGMDNGIWFSFFCTVFVEGISLQLFTTVFTAMPYQLLFIVTGLFTTFLNLGAAHSTYFMKHNFVTEKLLQNREVDMQ
ncbi:hypothetical protein, partial [Longispora fulva]|uniref:hypothetical protein n=1 Tax=Longispora fulva TaxID=619741 RepID=UPI00363A5910